MPNTSVRRALCTASLFCALLAPPAQALAQALAPPVLLEPQAPAVPPDVVLTQPVNVLVEITVEESGQVAEPTLLNTSGNSTLDALALDAARALRFTPATRDGVPIAARIPFRFDFQPPPPPPPPAPVAAPVDVPVAKAPAAQPIVLDVLGEKPPREATSHQISSETMRTMPGTNGDPMRSVEAMPGVARPSYINGDLIVRGSSPQDSVVFIDGIAVPNAYHFGGLSSVVPAEALTKLDFKPGNFGPEYGRAMGGVVDMSLRSPARDRYTGLIQMDTIDGRFLLQGPLGKKTRALIAGRRSWLDAWMGAVLNSEDVSFKAAPVYWDGQLMLEHDLTKRTTATLFAFGSNDKMEMLVKTPDEQDPGEGGKLAANSGFLRFGLRFRSELANWLTLTNTLSAGPDRAHIAFGTDVFNYTVQNFFWRSELRGRFSEQVSATAGVDVAINRYDLHINVKPYPTTDEAEGPYFARPTRLFTDKIWITRPAAYALLELTPLPGLRVVPAVRMDYSHDNQKVTVDPRLSTRATLVDGEYKTVLKAGVGMYSQPPQPQESVKPFGTDGIKSNRSVHASLGLEQGIIEGLTVSLEGFYKHLDRLVVAVPDEDGSPIGARFLNTGSGRAYGTELLIRYQSDSRFTGWLSYTLSRSERRNNDDESYHLFQYDQTHIMSALGNVRLNRGWSIGGRFRYVTGSPYTPYVGGVLDLDAGAYAAVSGSSYSGRLPSFNQLDLRVEKLWQIRSGKLTAYLELRNAYNRKNVEEISYNYDFSRHQQASGLPILPVIGLRGEL